MLFVVVVTSLIELEVADCQQIKKNTQSRFEILKIKNL
jgi:hypothetical protein